MIPSDWEVCPLNFFADILNGDRGVNYPKDSDFCDAGIPFINAGHLKKCQIDFSCMDYITYEHYKKLGGVKIKKNDILFCLRGSLGKYAYVNFDDAAPASSLCVLRSKKIDPKYLFQLLGFEYIKTQIIDANSGSSQPNLSAKDVGNFNVIFPPTIEEQQRIANALSDVDTLIVNLEKLIAKKKNIKQGAMQQLLTGHKRLPGFAPDERRKGCHSERSAKREVEESSGYKMTELGLIPSDWLQMKLRDLCYLITKQTGFDYSATIKPSLVTEESKETLPFIQNKDFEGTSINFATDFFIPKNIAANFPKILLNEPVLLISISGKIGNVAYFSHERDAFIGGAVGVARFNEKKYIKWTNLFLQSEYGQKQIFANEKSGAQHNLTIEDVRNLNVYMPSSCEEQTAIANVLSDMDAEISALETKLAKYRTLKTGMMQQLLTGKIRLIK